MYKWSNNPQNILTVPCSQIDADGGLRNKYILIAALAPVLVRVFGY
jgi:hypothetical protein